MTHTVAEVQWAFKHASIATQTAATWSIVLLDETLRCPPPADVGPQRLRLVPIGDLIVDTQRIWDEARDLQNDLWSPQVDASRALHMAIFPTIGNAILNLHYAATATRSAILQLAPDVVVIPPHWTSRGAKRVNTSFDHLPCVVANVARELGIRVNQHWSSSLYYRAIEVLSPAGQLMGYGIAALIDVFRLLLWGSARVLGKRPVQQTDSDTIVLTNADSDLTRQFDIRKLPVAWQQRIVVWRDVGRLEGLKIPTWPQCTLSEYLEGSTSEGRRPRSNKTRDLAMRVFPTSLTLLMLSYTSVAYCSTLPSSVRRGPCRLQKLFGGTGMAAERFLNFRRLFAMARQYCVAADALRAMQPALLVASDTIETHRALTLAARHAGVATLSTTHGISMLFEHIPKILSLALVYCRFDGTTVSPGVGKMEDWKVNEPVFWDTFSGPPAAGRHSSFPSGSRRILLITSLYSIGSHFTLSLGMNLRIYEESLKQLVETISSTSNLEIVIKSHPLNDHYELYEELLQAHPRTVKAHIRGPMAMDETLNADLAVVYNSATTLFFTMVASGVPILGHWGALTPLMRRVMAIVNLAGSEDSQELALLANEIIESPDGLAAQDARCKALAVYRRFVRPPGGGLAEAITHTLEQARLGR